MPIKVHASLAPPDPYMDFSLAHVEKIYCSWGRHPLFYKAACAITFLGRERRLRQMAVDALALRHGDTVLEVACGTGLNFEFLERAVGPKGNIVAFDYSKEMLEAAQKRAQNRGWNNIRFLQGDAAELELDTPVNAVISVLGISAIPRHMMALEKAVAALRQNGNISIMDARLPTGFWSMFNPLIAFVYTRWASWDYTKTIPNDIRRYIKDANMETLNGGTIFIVHGPKPNP